jgi:hypothetical protein
MRGDVMAAFLDKIETPCLRQLYAYWDARRGGREFPARGDIDPLDLKFVLGYLMLIDVAYEPLRFRFRLHGSELALRAGYDMTGKMVDELPNEANRAVLLQRCRSLIETRQPVAVINERLIEKRVFGYEAVWLPLAADGHTIDMLLGGLIYRDSREAGPLEWQAT